MCPFGAVTDYVDGYKIYLGGRWGKRVAQGRAMSKVLPQGLAQLAEEAGRLRGTDGYLPYVAGIFDREDSDGED